MGPQAPKRASADSISRILDAAAEEFSESGFAGARMDEIAERAGVNKATIYYHIGNKRTLYARVLHEHFSSAVERFDRRLRTAESPQQKLSSYVRQVSHEMNQNPHKATMMLREGIDGGRNIPDSVARDLADIITRLTGILTEGQEKGCFVHVNPLSVHFLITGALAFYRISEPVRKKIHQSLAPDGSEYAGGNDIFAGEVERLIIRALAPK